MTCLLSDHLSFHESPMLKSTCLLINQDTAHQTYFWPLADVHHSFPVDVCQFSQGDFCFLKVI